MTAPAIKWTDAQREGITTSATACSSAPPPVPEKPPSSQNAAPFWFATQPPCDIDRLLRRHLSPNPPPRK